MSRLSLALFFLAVSFVLAQNLTIDQVDAIKARLADAAKRSWENGTRAEALLELDAPALAVFASTPLPPPTELDTTTAAAAAPVFALAQSTVTARGNSTGPQPLVDDSAAGDPASLGVAVLLANWTQQGSGTVDYAGAARDQLEFLYTKVPHTSNGAISHRVSEVQLWSDFVYMVPPFLAYYGVTTANRSLLADAYRQIQLYRGYLVDAKGTGALWRHIALGQANTSDPGHWSTGNGWAAAGMLRVLATMQRSAFASTFKREQVDLANWVREIHDGMFPLLDARASLFHNYADDPNTFLDASSSALLAGTAYRLALLTGTYTHVLAAERVRQALSNGTAHVSAEGWLGPVVNPLAMSQQGTMSAEGQAFVLEMQAAWGAWVADGAKTSGAVRTCGLSWGVSAAALLWLGTKYILG